MYKMYNNIHIYRYGYTGVVYFVGPTQNHLLIRGFIISKYMEDYCSTNKI